MPDRDFATFPRRPLTMREDRRQLFSRVVTELQVADGQTRGGLALKLSDLGLAPDEHIGALMPARAPAVAIVERAGMLWASVAGRERESELFPCDSPAGRALAAFNGELTVDSIAAALVRETGWAPAYALSYVRGVFLYLVSLGVCLPGAP